MFPKLHVNRQARMVVSAFAVVFMAQIGMQRLAAPLMMPTNAEIVSQAAIASDASPNMPAIAGADCPITLDLIPDANAMIGVTLLAPCMANSDVMIAHAGMVFSAKTMASGALFLSLPAMTQDAQVAVRFAGGAEAQAAIDIPDMAGVRRFAVQWPESDGFAIHAFEANASFDDPGHIWAENLATPLPAVQTDAGYLTLLGDRETDMPMLAQVYTYPQNVSAEILVEAKVTAKNCGFDLMGDALSSRGGIVKTTEITLAMPDCDSVGQFVQIPDLDADPKLALAN